MSEEPHEQIVPGNGLRRATIANMLINNFTRLPDIDQKLFVYGPAFLGGNAGIAGLISNNLYRGALNVTQAPVASGLPMAVLPFLTTYVIYSAAVTNPLMFGDLNCPSCAVLRGALVGVIGGGVHPVFLALTMNMVLAARYNSAPIPEKGNVLRYLLDLSRPIVTKMRSVLLLQAIFGGYLGSKHFESFTKLAKLTFAPDGEDLESELS